MFHPPVWSVLPFAALLLAVAVLPLAAGTWWHHNRNKAYLAVPLAVLFGGYLLALPGGPKALSHGVQEYASFLAVLSALYVISGGIVVGGDLPARPRTNVLFLAAGAVLANLIGTTGASMVLVRPLLRTNRERHVVNHVPVFFIFVVSNCGGLLTALGDPPLFFGFLGGMDFFWTLRLWPEWLFVNGVLLAVFYAWDRRAYGREAPRDVARDRVVIHPLRVRGFRLNGVLLAGVIAAVVLKKTIPAFGPCELAILALAAISWRFTPKSVRHANDFEWGPIAEVAVLFLAIFVTMIPAVALVAIHGPRAGVTEPWQFFWLTGLLSGGLDNAPTYQTMSKLGAAVNNVAGVGELSRANPAVLAAVSCGAVFMGALTYIGNGPNFMVKAIAEKMGYRMPSFFGYMGFAAAVLLPVFAAATGLFMLGK